MFGGRHPRGHTRPVSLEHLIASPVGARIDVTATLMYVDGSCAL